MLNELLWQSIETVPKDETEVIIGRYDNDNNYVGWVWITMGCFDKNQFFCNFLDEDINLVMYRTATHWTNVLSAP